MPGSREGPVPIIRLFGITAEGNSVMAHVHGFTPYFYCQVPSSFDPSRHIKEFQMALDQALRGAGKQFERMPKRVLAVNMVERTSIMYYMGKAKQRFLQVYVAMPTVVPAARRMLSKGIRLPSQGHAAIYQCFEANCTFVLRFMIDRGIVGHQWLRMPKGNYKVRKQSQFRSKSQCEFDVVYDSIDAKATEGEWQTIAPFRILSYDIECKGRKGHFPDPKEDPVIQIANVLQLQGTNEHPVRNVFVLGTCTPIAGADVLTFRTEKEMLTAWAKFVLATDPDELTGYNTDNFDMPYLIERARQLGVKEFEHIGRIQGEGIRIRDTTFQSAAHGKRQNKETTIDGRVSFDMLEYMRRNHKLSSFSLNAVSAEFLGQQKEDVHHSIIGDLHEGSPDDRRRLAVYCLKDAWLPLRLMDKLMVMVNHIEMARVTGVPLDFLLKRGQQIKVVSMLYRKCLKDGLLIPTMERQGASADDTTYEGATVIEPKKAYYDEPIATLDFASLYPSIMQAHNLCYSTLLPPGADAGLKEGDYEVTPTRHRFVKPSVKKGVLPEILEELLSARKRAKRDMKAATDPMVKAVQNGRQLALKISANSVYGFTGATVGQLPCLEISSSVTSYGRLMIEQTKEAVERMYTVANGAPADADVVYGDTDSVMVKFGVPDVKTAMELGEKAADEVTKLFPHPVKLEFEKVYFPYLLMNKKRYAGLYWTQPEKWDKLDTKGIETVRRDNCALVRQVVTQVLRKILIDRSIKDAIEYTKGTISELLQGKVDISMLVITKALGKGASDSDYKAKQAHVELAERMRKRDPGTAPAVGDRVPYVITQAAKGAKAYEKSEDPIYVLEHGVPIDFKYYLDNQLSKPLMRIFGPIIESPQSLLVGDHTRAIKKTASTKKGGIMQFAVKRRKCLFQGCNVPLAAGERTVCATHKAQEAEAYRQRLELVTSKERKFA